MLLEALKTSLQVNFSCDYMEGAHPAILQRLAEINLDKNTGYGLDAYCGQARDLIRRLCRQPRADVHFLTGGTQTNAIVLDAMLRHNEGVLAAETGHINVHEAGAVEACGHKVIAMPSSAGKIDLDKLEHYLELSAAEFDAVGREHYVVPRAVYISFPTELGTLYTLDELRRLRELCDRHRLLLYVDGARLGYGLASQACEVTLPDLARLADAFYIGGTKVGALFGEAVVVTNEDVRLTRGLIKSRGALLAKGWLLGIQFLTLLEDGLYVEISRHAVGQALRLRQAMAEKGYRAYIDSPTNQQFFVLPDIEVSHLRLHVGFDVIAPVDRDHTLIRFCTSWATTEQQVDRLIELL